MVSRECGLSLARQCRLLSLGRTTLYYHPTLSSRTLQLMKRIDELFTEDPTRGTRRMCAVLLKEGITIGRAKVRRLMERMGLAAIYRNPTPQKNRCIKYLAYTLSY